MPQDAKDAITTINRVKIELSNSVFSEYILSSNGSDQGKLIELKEKEILKKKISIIEDVVKLKDKMTFVNERPRGHC
jgi:hypothetical protein